MPSGTIASLMPGYRPSALSTSLKLSPAACTSISTCPAAGGSRSTGTNRSASNEPACVMRKLEWLARGHRQRCRFLPPTVRRSTGRARAGRRIACRRDRQFRSRSRPRAARSTVLSADSFAALVRCLPDRDPPAAAANRAVPSPPRGPNPAAAIARRRSSHPATRIHSLCAGRDEPHRAASSAAAHARASAQAAARRRCQHARAATRFCSRNIQRPQMHHAETVPPLVDKRLLQHPPVVRFVERIDRAGSMPARLAIRAIARRGTRIRCRASTRTLASPRSASRSASVRAHAARIAQRSATRLSRR